MRFVIILLISFVTVAPLHAQYETDVERLLMEAQLMFYDSRPLDARTKLMEALSKDPKDYRVHKMLAGYYMSHVGHFRLAYRYIKQAEKLFYEKEGGPPYSNFFSRSEHEQILYLIAEALLNLDKYDQSLKTMENVLQYEYKAEWLPASRAWVLMKLGRIDEAVKQAKSGAVDTTEPGRILNILGILLSMTRDREQSIEIFNKAILYEMSLGSIGQPATPLNNIGEVYRETFKDDDAEYSWLRATSLPDGCEHILPTMNLVTLRLDQLNLKGAQEAIVNFEQCIAKYPLRNGEEHKAILHLAKGRLLLLSGETLPALAELELAMDRKQWFGKIGTNKDDLKVAIQSSLAKGLIAASNLPFQGEGVLEFTKHKLRRYVFKARAFWLRFKTRTLFYRRLHSFEDLFLRNTDSMLEYPTLGATTSGYPLRVLRGAIKRELTKDTRKEAAPYYNGYLGENYIYHGSTKKGQKLVLDAINGLRPRYDSALEVHLRSLLASTLQIGSKEYLAQVAKVYALLPSAVLQYGLVLPVAASKQALPTNCPLVVDMNSPIKIDLKEGRYIVGGMRDVVISSEPGVGLGVKLCQILFQ